MTRDAAVGRITPGSAFFFGRETAISAVKQALIRTNAVLLFGGRQAGKTSLLRNLQKANATVQYDASVLASCEIYVYIDLTNLPYEAKPESFYALLANKVVLACELAIKGFIRPTLDSGYQLESFIAFLESVRACCDQVDVRFVFLLDEAKRILGDRFPRGFQDNLFALLFGEASETARVAIVFSGTQHLNDFLKDDTSPIGSRSQSVHLSNLDAISLQALVKNAIACSAKPSLQEIPPPDLFLVTGGHAGLSAKLTEALVLSDAPHSLEYLSQELYESSLTLFENWLLSLSEEAKVIAMICAETEALTLQRASAELESKGLNRFLGRRAFEELQYTGVAHRSGETIVRGNPLFWRYFSEFGESTGYLAEHDSVWAAIAETELAMRDLIAKKLNAHYGSDWEKVLPQALGEKAWQGILATHRKSSKQYKFARNHLPREIMSCMYLGQLGTIMICGRNWDLFKAPYRDKRELEDKLAAIMPVRNDNAHFSLVPKKEQDRCRIACDDLLAIVEREAAVLISTNATKSA